VTEAFQFVTEAFQAKRLRHILTGLHTLSEVPVRDRGLSVRDRGLSGKEASTYTDRPTYLV
jgi:hypothetical protein